MRRNLDPVATFVSSAVLGENWEYLKICMCVTRVMSRLLLQNRREETRLSGAESSTVPVFVTSVGRLWFWMLSPAVTGKETAILNERAM